MTNYYSDPKTGCHELEKMIEMTLDNSIYNICSPKCIQDFTNPDPILSKLYNICPDTPNKNAACIIVDKINDNKHCVKVCTNDASSCDINEKCVAINSNLRICTHSKN